MSPDLSEEKDENRVYYNLTITFAVGAVSGILLHKFWIRHGRRIRNGDHVTGDMLEKKRWIKGRVTSVGDGDGFRLYHTPLLRIGAVPKAKKDLKDQTIRIRIAGADAPEGAYFGRPAQPFAVESHDWLKNKILDQKVYCELLQRDQYSRIVANVDVPRFSLAGLFRGRFSENLALEMLKAGHATTYEQASAVYGNEGKDAYLNAEKEARAKRRGMWKNGTKIELPAEYKRKYSRASPLAEKEGPQRTVIRRQPSKSVPVRFLRRLLKK
ncbi:hypothetical protein M378DRAFT_169508 [Amanita muscaria Koide BX008]|uniref:TNase-like domain-containing protein n=1 Tax=Amanita muscaria (strain Koide BX008) TaxID=946122 RepID=A0A0C2S8W6_AMAMK|nr:hypothetical protein M378DRAFT_169508 [Amanita muscaria Koide BX008]